MHIIWSIIIGFIIGLVAKFIMPGRDPGGFIITIILGIVGPCWRPMPATIGHSEG